MAVCIKLSGSSLGLRPDIGRAKPISKPEWVWNLTHQAHALGIPVFMKEDLLPIMGETQMVQEFPPAFYRVLEEQKT